MNKFQSDPKFLPPLKSARDAIQAALDAVNHCAGGLEKLRADEDKLNSDVARLESATSYADGEGVTTLETKKAQLARLRNQINVVSERVDPQLGALQVALNELRSIIPSFVKPELEADQERQAKVLVELFGDLPRAREVARGTLRTNSFAAFFISRQFGGYYDSIAEAREVLPILDSLINGENPWHFKVAPAPVIA